MIKRFIFIIIFLFASIISCQAQTLTKITQPVFDDSDNIIFLSTQNQIKTEVPQKIKIVSLEDPKRVYFDLPDSIITFPANTWTMQNSKIEQIKIAQTSTNPNIVRVVLTLKSDLPKLTVMQLSSGILIRYDTDITRNDYLSEFYRDTTSSKNDYVELTNYADENALKTKLSNEEVLKKVDESFNKINETVTGTKTSTTSVPAQNLSASNNYSKIKTKYYINRLDIKRGNILVSGIGSASFEKVKVLSEPNRVVYDLPNTILNPSLRNNEYKINETDSVRIGQFTQTKARIVITTKDTTKYKPVFSQDLQGILFAHDDRMANVRLFNNTTIAQNYTIKHTNDYDILTINFSAPILQALVRDYTNLDVILYNTKPIPTTFFTTNIKSTLFKDLKVEKLATTDKFQAGQRITIPIDRYDNVFAYEAQNGKQLVIKIEGQKVIERKAPAKTNNDTKIYKYDKNKKDIIIIDPGHGGADVGATRAGIYEKDINLDVAKMVVDNLRKQGYKVEMTRTGDTNPTLQDRCDFSLDKKSTIFVSIHTNASVNENATGVETHFYHDFSYDLATAIQKNLMKNIKASNRGTIKSMFYVINHTSVPAVLVEMGYISNERERKDMLTDKRKENTAKGISDGIMEYIKARK